MKKPHYKDHPFCTDHGMIYLDTYTNNKSGMIYDFYASKYEGRMGFACVHGNNPEDYGSGPIDSVVISEKIMNDISKDYLFGICAAKMLAMDYFMLRRD